MKVSFKITINNPNLYIVMTDIYRVTQKSENYTDNKVSPVATDLRYLMDEPGILQQVTIRVTQNPNFANWVITTLLDRGIKDAHHILDMLQQDYSIVYSYKDVHGFIYEIIQLYLLTLPLVKEDKYDELIHLVNRMNQIVRGEDDLDLIPIFSRYQLVSPSQYNQVKEEIPSLTIY